MRYENVPVGVGGGSLTKEKQPSALTNCLDNKTYTRCLELRRVCFLPCSAEARQKVSKVARLKNMNIALLRVKHDKGAYMCGWFHLAVTE